MQARFTRDNLKTIKESLEQTMYHIQSYPNHPCRDEALEPVVAALDKIRARLRTK